LREKLTYGKNCFKWWELSPNTKRPLFVSANFSLPNQILGIEEPRLVTSQREFLRCLPEAKRNIILTGDPGQEFDPFNFGWIYTFPELVVHKKFSTFFNSKKTLTKNKIIYSTNQLNRHEEADLLEVKIKKKAGKTQLLKSRHQTKIYTKL
jgi:hypothetical protein